MPMARKTSSLRPTPSGLSDDPVVLGQRARRQLPLLIEAVRHDDTMARWNPAALPTDQLAAFELIEGWRAWLHSAGFGEEFQLYPHASRPNRYWDPAVTRLWNHHAVVTALYELVEFAIDARTLTDDDLEEFLQAAPWHTPLDVLHDVAPRIAGNMDGWFEELA